MKIHVNKGILNQMKNIFIVKLYHRSISLVLAAAYGCELHYVLQVLIL